MRSQSLPPDMPGAHDDLSWLPRSRVSRTVLAVLATIAGTLVFAAWISPNMVFDLANMVFCG